MDEETLIEDLGDLFDPEAGYLHELSVYLSSNGVPGLEPTPPFGYVEDSEVLLGGLRNIIYTRYSPEVSEQAAAATTVTELLALINGS